MDYKCPFPTHTSTRCGYVLSTWVIAGSASCHLADVGIWWVSGSDGVLPEFQSVPHHPCRLSRPPHSGLSPVVFLLSSYGTQPTSCFLVTSRLSSAVSLLSLLCRLSSVVLSVFRVCPTGLVRSARKVRLQTRQNR